MQRNTHCMHFIKIFTVIVDFALFSVTANSLCASFLDQACRHSAEPSP